jgi:hypothetical protein
MPLMRALQRNEVAHDESAIFAANYSFWLWFTWLCVCFIGTATRALLLSVIT